VGAAAPGISDCRSAKMLARFSFIRSTDTSDPGHFGHKTVRHYVFGTEMSYFFSAGAEVSLGHLGTSAELSQHFMKGPKCPADTSALVPKCLGQIGCLSRTCGLSQALQLF